MPEIAHTFARIERPNVRPNTSLQPFDGALRSFAQECLERMENQLYGIEVRGVLRQITEGCANSPDRLLHTSDLAEGHVVDDHNVPTLERRGETLLDVSQECFAIHGSFDQHRSHDAGLTEAGDKRHRVPVPHRSIRDQALSTRVPAVESHHIRGDCRLVNKYEAGGVKPALLADPPPPRASHVGSLSLCCLQAFLRNGRRCRWLEDEAEGLGTATQILDDPRAITDFVGGRAGISVVHPVTQGVVEENRDLACGGGGWLDLADARGEPPVKGSESGVGSSHRHRGEPQERRGPAPRAARARREHLAPGDLVAWRQAKPGGEVLGARPGGEVVTALGDQLEREVWAEAVDLREVLAEQRKERRANIEPRAVRLPAHATARRGQRTDLTAATQAELLQDGLDPGIAGRCLLLVCFVKSERLLECKEVLGTVIPRERLCDRFDAGVAARVAQMCQHCGITLAYHDCPDDPKPGLAGDVRDDVVKL